MHTLGLTYTKEPARSQVGVLTTWKSVVLRVQPDRLQAYCSLSEYEVELPTAKKKPPKVSVNNLGGFRL
jgi:hypothetical protein